MRACSSVNQNKSTDYWNRSEWFRFSSLRVNVYYLTVCFFNPFCFNLSNCFFNSVAIFFCIHKFLVIKVSVGDRNSCKVIHY